MSGTAIVNLRFQGGSAESRIRRMSLDADSFASSWARLPKDIRSAGSQLQRLHQDQMRFGYLRRNERQERRQYLDYLKNYEHSLKARRDRVEGLIDPAARSQVIEMQATGRDPLKSGDSRVRQAHKQMQSVAARNEQIANLGSVRDFQSIWGAQAAGVAGAGARRVHACEAEGDER